jgi:hypothetical protein
MYTGLFMVVMRASESEPRVANCSGLSACHAFRFLLPATYACPVHKLHSRNIPYRMTFGCAYYLVPNCRETRSYEHKFRMCLARDQQPSILKTPGKTEGNFKLRLQ